MRYKIDMILSAIVLTAFIVFFNKFNFLQNINTIANNKIKELNQFIKNETNNSTNLSKKDLPNKKIYLSSSTPRYSLAKQKELQIIKNILNLYDNNITISESEFTNLFILKNNKLLNKLNIEKSKIKIKSGINILKKYTKKSKKEILKSLKKNLNKYKDINKIILETGKELSKNSKKIQDKIKTYMLYIDNIKNSDELDAVTYSSNSNTTKDNQTNNSENSTNSSNNNQNQEKTKNTNDNKQSDQNSSKKDDNKNDNNQQNSNSDNNSSNQKPEDGKYDNGNNSNNQDGNDANHQENNTTTPPNNQENNNSLPDNNQNNDGNIENNQTNENNTTLPPENSGNDDNNTTPPENNNTLPPDNNSTTPPENNQTHEDNNTTTPPDGNQTNESNNTLPPDSNQTNDNNSSNEDVDLKELNGVVINKSYIQDALVCIDSNQNSICDNNEYFTRSDFFGRYNLRVPKRVLDSNPQIIATGGYDRGYRNSLKLKIYASQKNLTTITTTSKYIIDQTGRSAAWVKDFLFNALNISKVSIFKDYINESINGNNLPLKAALKLISCSKIIATYNDNLSTNGALRVIANKISNRKTLNEVIETFSDSVKLKLRDIVQFIDKTNSDSYDDLIYKIDSRVNYLLHNEIKPKKDNKKQDSNRTKEKNIEYKLFKLIARNYKM